MIGSFPSVFLADSGVQNTNSIPGGDFQPIWNTEKYASSQTFGDH
jgi:hypothetical protein